MNQRKSAVHWINFLGVAGFALALGGCDGDPGPQGPPGPSTVTTVHPATATTLSMTITGVTVASPPTVTFSVTNENGVPVSGLTLGDLRFTVAKLISGDASTGGSSNWQNYVNTTQTGRTGNPGAGTTASQATRENNGTLVDNKDGTYRYTFNTDITNASCPAPCTDSAGNPLNVTYDPNLPHRVGIQTRGALAEVNAVYTFRPSDGATVGFVGREIVKTAKCNECHDRIVAHDARIETKYCVLCHNPGSKDPDSGNTVDFKVMIHKIHRGASLPSVVAGTQYRIWGFRNSEHNFSTIVLPQNIKNCAKCHDGADADTPQGNNWYNVPTRAACGSCHDNVDFATGTGHSGGARTDSTCRGCHSSGGEAGSVQDSHRIFEKIGAGKFRFEILTICGTAVGSNPVCTPGTAPVVTFQVVDPTGGAHAFGDKYDVRSTGPDPEFNNSTGQSTLNILAAWDTRDYNNTGGSGTRPARANSVNARTTAASLGGGVFQVTFPGGSAIPVTAERSGTIAIEGHPAAAGKSGTFTDAVQAKAKAVVAEFVITGSTATARRQVVDITTKCDRCHDLLSIHGNNRSDEEALCIMCHNPNNTDYARRPRDGAGLLIGDQISNPLTGATFAVDGKKEESIDFKRMIHAIHAAAKTNFDGTIAHGFRNKGVVVYGYGGTAHDYSHVRFPGVLSKCETCHLPDTFKLTDRTSAGGANWAEPVQSGILGSTISSIPNAVDAGTVTSGLASHADDLKISPTAAVCSACHDSTLAREHMILVGGASFSATQAVINTRVETCAVCHGPGKIASVEFVHDPDFGADIP